MLPAVRSAPVGATVTAATVAFTFTFVATQVIIIIVAAAAGVVAVDITFYSPYIQSLFDFSAFLIFPLQGRISLLFSLTFLPRAELRMRNGSAQDFSRHAAHEMKIVVTVVGGNNGALGSETTRQPHVGKFSSELSQSFVLAPQRS